MIVTKIKTGFNVILNAACKQNDYKISQWDIQDFNASLEGINNVDVIVVNIGMVEFDYDNTLKLFVMMSYERKYGEKPTKELEKYINDELTWIKFNYDTTRILEVDKFYRRYDGELEKVVGGEELYALFLLGITDVNPLSKNDIKDKVYKNFYYTCCMFF